LASQIEVKHELKKDENANMEVKKINGNVFPFQKHKNVAAVKI